MGPKKWVEAESGLQRIRRLERSGMIRFLLENAF